MYNLRGFFFKTEIIPKAENMLVQDLHIPLNSMVKLSAFQTAEILCLKLIRMTG